MSKDSKQKMPLSANVGEEMISSDALSVGEQVTANHISGEVNSTSSKENDKVLTSSDSALIGTTETIKSDHESKVHECYYKSMQHIPMFSNEFSDSVLTNEQFCTAKLYAGNLSLKVTETDLRDVFVGYNVVSVSVFPSHDPLSRVNHAIIEFSTPKEAQRALEEVTGTVLDDFLIDLQPFGDEPREYTSPLSEDGEPLAQSYLTISPPPAVTPTLTLSSLEPILRNGEKGVQEDGSEHDDTQNDDKFLSKSYSERTISSPPQYEDEHCNQDFADSRSDGLQWQSISMFFSFVLLDGFPFTSASISIFYPNY